MGKPKSGIHEKRIGKRQDNFVILSWKRLEDSNVSYGCLCDCGKIFNVYGKHLSNTRGCPECGRASRIAHATTHRHGNSRDRLYRIWGNIKSRCLVENNPSYTNYGARGITICEEWKTDFKAFYDWSKANGYSDELTIDRIDNDKGYSPKNCRWVTATVQSRNKRTTHFITIDGETLCVADWANKIGVSSSAICQAIKRGTPAETYIKRKLQAN